MKKIEFYELEKNGQIIRGMLHHPEQSNQKVIIFLNGYRSGFADGSRAQKIHSDYLSGRGYEVVRFDYLGYGESDGDFAQANVTSMVDDTIDVIRYCIKKFPGYEIIVAGASMGGLIALATANKNLFPEQMKRITLSCPALDFYNVYMNSGFKEGMSTPMTDIEDPKYVEHWEVDLAKYKNIMNEVTFSGKIYVMHGDKDPVIPYETIRDWAEKNGYPLHTVEGGDHGFKLPGLGAEAIRRSLRQREELNEVYNGFIDPEID